MLRLTVSLIMFVFLFNSYAHAMNCPEKIIFTVKGMTFRSPGYSFINDRLYTEIDKGAIEYHKQIEKAVIDRAHASVNVPFKLIEITKDSCSYKSKDNEYYSATIVRGTQEFAPIIEGYPEAGESYTRLVVRMPMFLGGIGKDISYWPRYLNGNAIFYVWLKDLADDRIVVSSYDQISAMLKYEVDFEDQHFFYPLGVSGKDEIQVTSLTVGEVF